MGRKSSFKNIATSTQILLALIIILPIVVSLWLVLTYPPSLFKLLPRIEGDGAIPITLGEESFETLIVKVYYPSELASVMGDRVWSEARGNLSTTIIGEFLRIRWQGETVGVGMINDTEHVFNMKELKREEKQLKLSAGDSLIDLTIRLLNLSYPRLPEDFKKRMVMILENQSFIKWLKEEGFTYSVESIRPAGALGGWGWIMTSNMEIELLVDGIEASCILTLKETYKLVSNSNASRELQLFLREGNKTNGVCAYIYKYGDGFIVGTIVGTKNPYDPGYTYSMGEAWLKNSSSNIWISPSTYVRVSIINATSELGQRIMQVLSSNRLTGRLIEYGFKVDLVMTEKYPFDETSRYFYAYFYYAEKEVVVNVNINPDAGRIEKISFIARE
ncbi:MAG: hypothetical protein FGF50_04935 [Candidatus Brockarchaeota archaeon]|nr:hypothetical protein [Candidatus Brockarchaeota archaeon]